MRPAPRRALAAYLLSSVCIAGIAAAITTSGPAFAATSSQCQPLPSTATPSPTTIQAELCVSVQTSQSSIKTGQAASFTVQVWVANGSASGVSVTLTGAPAGEQPVFTGRCPSGDGSATCTIGSLATQLAPSTFQMQAQIPVAAGTTSVTSVTLTVTAGAATSPVMSVLPAAAETVAVSAPTVAARTPAASPPPASTPSLVAAPATVPATVPALVATPASGLAHPLPVGATTSLTSPAGVASVLPPVATPAVNPPPSFAAATATPSGGSYTLVVTTASVELLGGIVLGLVLLFAAMRLVRQRLAERQARKPGGRGKKKQLRFWPLWPPSRWRAAPGKGSQDRARGTPAENADGGAAAEGTDGMAAHSGADPAAEHRF
jgi:hypothetical protein